MKVYATKDSSSYETLWFKEKEDSKVPELAKLSDRKVSINSVSYLLEFLQGLKQYKLI
jgi:hypothetical protein